MSDPLPSNVMYYVNQIAGYSKNTVRLQNLNSETAGPAAGASQTTVTMPTNSIINLKSLSLHCNYQPSNMPMTNSTPGSETYDRVYALCPKDGISALVQRLSWSAGGVALDNGPTPYNVIQAVKNNTEVAMDRVLSDQKVLNNSVIEEYSLGSGVNYVQFETNDDSTPLICNEWAGFTEAAPCFLDTNMLPELRLTIQWEGANAVPIQYEDDTNNSPTGSLKLLQLGQVPQTEAGLRLPTSCSYSLRNMFWTVEVISFSNGLLDAMNEQIMSEDGALDVVYPQYQIFSVDGQSTTGSVRGGVSTMSLDRVYGLMRKVEKAPGTYTPGDNPAALSYLNQQTPTQLGFSQIGPKFINGAQNFFSQGVDSYQFKINNAPYPLYRETKLGGYNSLVCAENRPYSKHGGSQITSRFVWFDNNWTPVVSLCHEGSNRFISGLDLRSINSQINWDYYGSGANPQTRQVLLMTKQSSLLKIGQGRQLAVVN